MPPIREYLSIYISADASLNFETKDGLISTISYLCTLVLV